MPATELLRPAGHARINAGIRWVSKQADGLYLQSQYGILRISPIGSAIARITFSKQGKILDGTHPLIAVNRVEKGWKYRENSRIVELSLGELILRIDKPSGAIQYLDGSGKLLLAERSLESRLQEAGKNWLYLDFAKGEQLYALNPEAGGGLKLRGSARYIAAKSSRSLPFILSDKGYGLLPAASGNVIFCDVPAYGSYVCTESEQMDYYFIAAKQQKTILNAFSYLCGLI
jgi:DNA helicase-2/ATP-dependent DNA helicase PcrA